MVAHHVVQDPAGSVRLTFIPQPFTLDGWEYASNKLNPAICRLFLNSAVIALAVTLSNLVLAAWPATPSRACVSPAARSCS